jgi:hypothetical protein
MIQQQAIRQEIAGMMQHEPGLSFAAAWRRLKETKPWLFPPEFGARSMSSSNDATGPQGNPQIRKAQAVIHAAVGELQRSDGLTFQEAWRAVKQKRPELFSRLLREASGESTPLKKIYGVAEHDSPERDYIEIRAEDSDELERQVASGMWS